MTLHRILAILLIIRFMTCFQPANAQATNTQAGGTTTTAVLPLQSLLPSIDLTTKTSAKHDGEMAPVTISQATNAKAGIYSTKAIPPLKALLLSLDPTAKVFEVYDGSVTNFTCEWPDVSARFTIKPNWDGTVQCAGMKNWILGFPAGATNTPAVGTLLHQIDATMACIGAVITPQYDAAGKASTLVLALATRLDGYVFAQQSFYDGTGAKIIGAANAPLKWEYKK